MEKLEAIKEFLTKIENCASHGGEIDPMEVNESIREIIDYESDDISDDYLDKLVEQCDSYSW